MLKYTNQRKVTKKNVLITTLCIEFYLENEFSGIKSEANQFL